jgi:hypothetical protein
MNWGVLGYWSIGPRVEIFFSTRQYAIAPGYYDSRILSNPKIIILWVIAPLPPKKIKVAPAHPENRCYNIGKNRAVCHPDL